MGVPQGYFSYLLFAPSLSILVLYASSTKNYDCDSTERKLREYFELTCITAY